MSHPPVRLALMLAASTLTTALATGARAQDGEFALGIGYAHIAISGASEPLDDQNGFRFEPRLSLAPLEQLPQLRIGGAFGWSTALDNFSGSIVSSGGAVAVANADQTLSSLEPQFQLSWRQYLGRDESFFLEPGVGIGAAFIWLNIDDTRADLNEWATTFAASAFLRAGWEVPGGRAGLEAAYIRGGSVDFAPGLGGDLAEFYIGIFGALHL